MTAIVFAMILAFVSGMFFSMTEGDGYMWWPITISFMCLAALHTVPAVQKAAQGEQKDSKWTKVIKLAGPYVAAALLATAAAGISALVAGGDADDYYYEDNGMSIEEVEPED